MTALVTQGIHMSSFLESGALREDKVYKISSTMQLTEKNEGRYCCHDRSGVTAFSFGEMFCKWCIKRR